MNIHLDCSRAGQPALVGASHRGGTAVLPALLISLCGWLTDAGAADSLHGPVAAIIPAVITEAGINTGPAVDSGPEALANEINIDDIHFGPEGCTYRNPEITISPAEAQWAPPGTPIEYTVIVTNTSSTSCDITNFDLSASIPPGWEVSLDGETLEIASDWSTGIVTMVVTSPASVVSGSHDIMITAGNEFLSIDSSATATYVVDTDTRMAASTEDMVATPDANQVDVVPSDVDDAGQAANEDTGIPGTETCIRSAPNLSLSPAPLDRTSPARPGFSYSVSLTNNDGTECAVSNFDITLVFLTAGWNGSLSTRHLSLAPGESGSATLALTPSSTVPTGKYMLQLAVSDATSPEHTKTSVTNLVSAAASNPVEAEHD
jgi:hypothetical protein